MGDEKYLSQVTYLLQLIEDHIASVRDRVRENNFGHLLHVRLPGIGVS
jgi:hypothetical protein